MSVATESKKRRKIVNPAQRGLQYGIGDEKFLDLSVVGAGGSLSVDTQVQLLNGITRGDDINQRNGRTVNMTTVQIKIRLNCVTTPAFCQTRVLLVYDKQTNGTAFTTGDLIGDVPPVHSSTIFNFILLENRRRFIVLKDEMYLLGQSGFYEKFYWGFWTVVVDLPVVFNAGNAGTVADISTGSLYLVSMSDTSALSNNTFSFCSRLGYFDV